MTSPRVTRGVRLFQGDFTKKGRDWQGLVDGGIRLDHGTNSLRIRPSHEFQEANVENYSALHRPQPLAP